MIIEVLRILQSSKNASNEERERVMADAHGILQDIWVLLIGIATVSDNRSKSPSWENSGGLDRSRGGIIKTDILETALLPTRFYQRQV